MTIVIELLMEIKESLCFGGRAEKKVRDWRRTRYQLRCLEILMFFDENPCGWILKAESYFILYGIDEGDKVAYATLCMEGKALNWLLWMEARNLIRGWQMFKDELKQRFRSTKGRFALEQLLSLKQSTTVAHYREQFEFLSSRLTDVHDHFLRCTFINGLNDDVRAEVQLAGPRDLAQVISLAQEIEDGNKISEEMEETELTGSFWDPSEVRSCPFNDSALPSSLHPRERRRFTIKTNSPTTFYFVGKIGSREVTVVIGTATAHNFVSKELVTELQIPVERTSGFHVDGSKVEGVEVCNNVVLKIQGQEIVQRFFPIDLAIADVLCGKRGAKADVLLGGEGLRRLGKFSLA